MVIIEPDFRSRGGPWISELFAAKGQSASMVGFTLYDNSAPTTPLQVEAQILEFKKVEGGGIGTWFGILARLTFQDEHTELVRGEHNPLSLHGWFNRI